MGKDNLGKSTMVHYVATDGLQKTSSDNWMSPTLILYALKFTYLLAGKGPIVDKKIARAEVGLRSRQQHLAASAADDGVSDERWREWPASRLANGRWAWLLPQLAGVKDCCHRKEAPFLPSSRHSPQMVDVSQARRVCNQLECLQNTCPWWLKGDSFESSQDRFFRCRHQSDTDSGVVCPPICQHERFYGPPHRSLNKKRLT